MSPLPKDQLSISEKPKNIAPSPSPRKKSLCICVTTLLLITFTVTGILVGWVFRVKPFNDGENTGLSGRVIQFEVALISVDPAAGTMVLDWSIINDTCRSNPVSICGDVDIFFDTNLLRDTARPQPGAKPSSNDVPTTPIFHVNSSALNSDNLRSNAATFRTSIALFSDHTSRRGETLQDYPFDKYTAELFVFAQDSVTNETVPIQKLYTSGIAVGFVATATDSDDTGDINDPINLARSGLVKTYVLTIIIGVWAITLIFLVATTKVIFGYHQNPGTLAIPVTSMFTITSIRSTMPGAPPNFGAIVDFVGILPCLAIMIFCSAILCSYLTLSHPERKRSDTWADKLTRKFANTEAGRHQEPGA